MRGVRSSAGVTVCLVAFLASTAAWADELLPRSILVLDQSDMRGPFPYMVFSGLRATVNASASSSVTIYVESLDLSRFSGRNYAESLQAHFRVKYRDKPIGVIVAVGSATLDYVLRRRAELWPGVPVVFAMVDEPTVARLELPPDVTGTVMKLRFEDMMVTARAVVPDLERIAILGDPWESQTAYRHFLDEIPTAAANVEVIDLTGLPMAELRSRVADLPERTAILYTAIYGDGAGTFYPPADAVALVAEVANRPIVVTAETLVGRGGIGGFVMTPSAIGEEAARLALRILDGEGVSNIPIATGHIVRPVFDWRQLQRWGVSEAQLPMGSETRFHELTMWEQHRWQLLAIITAIAAQAALISLLLYERRRRHRLEVVARNTMSELAHVNRIATAGILSASIAHEVNQPLAGIVASASAGLRWLSAATPDVDRARASLTQIVQAGHRASDVTKSIRAMFKRDTHDRSPLNINRVIWAVLALARIDLRKHQITLHTHLGEQLPAITGDRVQLQQVLLNLIMNAVESMTSVEARPRVLHVSSKLNEPDGVLVSVEDSGTGIAPDDANRIFQPLYTTKSRGMGMGLSICRSVIEAHNGRLWASAGATHGSVFQFVLPTNGHKH
jgi:signal transduction histidine kinase